MKSTTEIKKMYDLGFQYDVFEPWLKANGFELENLPLTAETEDGENVIVEAYRDENGELVWKISTLQDNGWMRINIYYSDHTVEELYKR